jgi:hypothetical protein
MFRKSGLKADVAIWQEPQVDKGHPSPQHFIRAVKYYGPAVREHYPLVYDASGHAGPTGWVKYYPGDDSIDKVAVDFYAHHFATGERIEAIAALADKASPAKPFGVWEMGDRSAHAPKPPPAQVRAYFSYLESFMSQRLADGKTNADMAWYDAGASAIRSASDFRAPLWHKLVTATS